MADDLGLQRGQHLVLLVVVALVHPLLVAPGGVHGVDVHLAAVVDGHGVDVVQGADEVVDGRVGGERADEGAVGRAVPLALEADEEVDLGGVLCAQALGLGEVGVVARGEDCEGLFGVALLELFSRQCFCADSKSVH